MRPSLGFPLWADGCLGPNPLCLATISHIVPHHTGIEHLRPLAVHSHCRPIPPFHLTLLYPALIVIVINQLAKALDLSQRTILP